MSLEQDVDFAFVGAGLSSTATLMKLIEGLDSHAGSAPLRIAMIEKTGEFFSGIAYGDRSGPTALIITPLDEFLPAHALDSFIAWMTEHQDRLAADLEGGGGALSRALVERFRQALADGTASTIHVPRSFYGRYLAERATGLLRQAEKAGLVDCRLIAAEVNGLERTEGGYRIETAEGPIDSRKVVLGLGAPPSRALFSDSVDDASARRLIEDPYRPSIGANLAVIHKILTADDGEEAPHIFLIGANASCLETLYLLCDDEQIAQRRPVFHVLSPQGRLPECFVAVDRLSFHARALEALCEEDQVAAAAVLDAVKADLATARTAGLAIGETMPVISRLVGSLVSRRMSTVEQQAFVNHAGVEIGRLQRRAGKEYSSIADVLSRAGRLHVLAGRFDGVAARGDGRLKIAYWEVDSDTRRTLDGPIALAVNCSGSAGLARPNACPLIERLLQNGLCAANDSSFGLRVDDQMRAHDDLYVIGPMLAGNVIAGTPIWHVEHCGRILDFSAKLADELLLGTRVNVAAE